MPVEYYAFVALIVLYLIGNLPWKKWQGPDSNESTPKCCSQVMSRTGLNYAPRVLSKSYSVESIQVFHCSVCNRTQVVTTKVFEHQNEHVANKVMDDLSNSSK